MKIKKIFTIISIVALIVIILCLFAFQNRTAVYESENFSMDTLVSFRVWGKSSDAEKSKQLVSALDNDFSVYGAGILSAINKTGSASASSCPQLIEVINKSNSLSSTYGDAVDISSGSLTKLWGVSTDSPHLPTKEEAAKAISYIDYSKIKISDDNTISVPEGTELDLGAVAKGYACDKLKEFYDNEKVSCAIVSMGSSSLLYGTKPDKTKFTVEIKNPEGGQPLGLIETGQTFISTSGGYERFFEVNGEKYSHIFNLKTGFPAESDITSVTVLCDSGIKSDFLSTLIFIDDTKGLKNHLNASDYKIVVATKDGKVYCSKGLDFVLNDGCGFVMGEEK